jgi:4-hydroxy-tetrahydrodipicolinate synthase
MELSGVYVPLITPFDETGAVAADSLERLAHDVLDAGASGLVALGTTGEPDSLTPDEQRQVVDVARRVSGGRGAGLIVGAGLATSEEAALVLVPPFIRPGEDGVLAYFRHIAQKRGNIVVYHIPYRTGQVLSAAALRKLGAIDGVIGLKHAAGITADTVALMADPPPGLAILGGDDQFIAPMLALGAHGGILASAHIATVEFVDLADAWRTGDIARARTLGHRLATVSAALFAEPNPTALKAVLHAQGRIPTPRVRLPLLPAHQYTTEEVLRRL